VSAPYREEFASFTEFLRAVVVAGISRNQIDPRLVIDRRAGPTGISEQTGADGSFLVPDTWAAGIWERVYATGQIISRTDYQPVTRGNGIIVPTVDERSRADGSRFGGVRMYWLDEATQIPKSKPALAAMKLQVKKLVGLVYATDELIEDAVALDVALQRMFANEATAVLEDQIVNGIGGGRFLGILKSGALITVPAPGAQASASLIYQNFSDMVGRLWNPTSGKAVWLMNGDVFTVLLNMRDGAGAPIINTDGDVFRILTYPVVVCDCTPALGAVGDVILCDLSQYVIAQREPQFIGPIAIRFLEGESAFKIRFRTDGQPGWTSPVTRRNSVTTESPFIALGARP
jgi:HK97 family phage major capsid protein